MFGWEKNKDLKLDLDFKSNDLEFYFGVWQTLKSYFKIGFNS